MSCVCVCLPVSDVCWLCAKHARLIGFHWILSRSMFMHTLLIGSHVTWEVAVVPHSSKYAMSIRKTGRVKCVWSGSNRNSWLFILIRRTYARQVTEALFRVYIYSGSSCSNQEKEKNCTTTGIILSLLDWLLFINVSVHYGNIFSFIWCTHIFQSRRIKAAEFQQSTV